MNFAGYVPLRRGIIEHLQVGRLTMTECLVFMVLIMLADSGTGSGTINGPTLRTFIPEISYDAAKRVLSSLEHKRYIFREIVPFSTRVYRYVVNRYVLTTGPHRTLQINLSKVFETRDTKDIQYINVAPEGALEGAPEGALEGAPNYKKEKREKRKETKPSVVQGELSASMNQSASASMQRTMSEGMCASQSASLNASLCASSDASFHASSGASPVTNTPESLPGTDTRIPILVRGPDAHYLDPVTRRRMDWLTAEKIVAAAERGGQQ